MSDSEHAFEFEFSPGKIRCERGGVAGVGDELARRGLERALVVCGSTVGSTPEVVDPVREGVGDRLVGVFPETTPEKYLGTAVEGAERADEENADALVALGGGSSLDTAKVVSALRSHDGPPEAVASDAIENGSLSVAEDGEPTPIVAVPTTLAGADLSTVAGVTLAMGPEDDRDGEAPGGGIADPRLMPTALCYDADLFATTPESVLTASAMNGFDKGLEALYTRNATPITDGTATRGLRLLRHSLPALADGRGRGADADGDGAGAANPDDPLAQAVTGTILVQYGVSTPGQYKLSIVHAFGHGLTEHADVHQGRAHAAVVPHVLRYLFEGVDARRELLAEALAVPAGGSEGRGASDEELADGVVDAVVEVRDGLGLPSRLRDLDGIERDDLPEVAETTAADGLMDTVPDGLDPTTDDLLAVLEAAW
ncbi:iron-containing alcohol dehydrogenase family protein [Halobium salinum]|uniref:Iron-containing alcohol dehydrogenase family protein n=1 Tax=Halobium salinum TaxID=1364940 RepID=A0ABD5PFM5_9EURY|nr:iron-containing alcohol dehydrogenase family protein [Halobium salinum]